MTDKLQRDILIIITKRGLPVSQTDKNSKNFGERKKVNSYNNGPYFCDREKFLNLYEIEKRRSDREWHSSFLVLFKISPKKEETIGTTGKDGANSLAEAEQSYQQSQEVPDNFTNWLEEILTRGIRQGDVICRWSEKKYTILLHDIKEEDVEKVIKRIKDAYKNKLSSCPHQDCWYNIGGKCKSRNLKHESKAFCSQLLYMRKNELVWSYYRVQR